MEGKQRELELADRKLANLNNQLLSAEKKVATTAEQLVRLTDLLNRSRPPVAERERDDIERKLGDVRKTVT